MEMTKLCWRCLLYTSWDAVHAQAKELDELINEFNEATGLLKAL